MFKSMDIYKMNNNFDSKVFEAWKYKNDHAIKVIYDKHIDPIFEMSFDEFVVLTYNMTDDIHKIC